MSSATLEKTPQETIERLAKRKNGFTSVELAKERGHPGNHCGPFTRSIKAAIKKGTIIATSLERNGKVVYQKNPDAPKTKTKVVKKTTKATKPKVARKSSRATTQQRTPPQAVGAIHEALGGNPQAASLLGDFFESLAGICRGLA